MLRCLLLLAAPAAAQLDLGSQEISRTEIDAYMDPFYRVVSAGLGGGRFTPRDASPGWDLGFQAGAVPFPDRKPFQSTSLSALPVFRIRAGARLAGAGAMARGLVWKDPRIGDMATFGFGLAYEREVLAAPCPLALALMGGWDHLHFSSTYTYRYRGSALGLFDQDIPADYSLDEQALGGGMMLSARFGKWIPAPYLQGWYGWSSGRFAYLYLDPREDRNRKAESELGFPGLRGSIGALWHGLYAEAGLGSYLTLEAGWSWIR